MLQRVHAFLEQFPSSEEMAAECRLRKLRGVPCDAGGCIVVKLIKDEYPQAIDVEVGPDNQLGLTVNFDSCDLPPHAKKLAQDFDDGKYEDLVDPSSYAELEDAHAEVSNA